VPDERFPLVLTTGRLAGHWHTRTKTGLVEELVKLDPAPYVRMNPADTTRLNLCDGQFIEVESRRGLANGVLRVDGTTPAGMIFMPMHWNDQWAHRASPNEATTDAADPISRQPALKASAVAVRARKFSWSSPTPDGPARHPPFRATSLPVAPATKNIMDPD
jgi:ferredoxin-nitrate reductase